MWVGNQDAEWGNNGLTEIKAARGYSHWKLQSSNPVPIQRLLCRQGTSAVW